MRTDTSMIPVEGKRHQRGMGIVLAGIAALLLGSLLAPVANADSIDQDVDADIRSQIENGEIQVVPGTDLSKPIITPEMSPEEIQRSHCQTNAGWAPPFTEAEYASSCSVAGSPGFELSYGWYVPNWSNGQACSRVMGLLYLGLPSWWPAGCGTSGDKTVRWGNYLGTPKYRTQSTAVPLGTPTIWGTPYAS